MSAYKDNTNITFFLDDFLDENENVNENVNVNVNLDINLFLQEFENTEVYNDLLFPQTINYIENYTVKELLLICEYYGFAKDLKNKKYNKNAIVNFLVEFEINPSNNDIVFKRKNMWFYINELKNDKFMKKYVLW
jgi:hypothetical protein